MLLSILNTKTFFEWLNKLVWVICKKVYIFNRKNSKHCFCLELVQNLYKILKSLSIKCFCIKIILQRCLTNINVNCCLLNKKKALKYLVLGPSVRKNLSVIEIFWTNDVVFITFLLLLQPKFLLYKVVKQFSLFLLK